MASKTTTQNRLHLARKYRPRSLDEVVGQSLAVKNLREALRTNRIAPAYLFSGPRGTGKTTCARIFARAAICLEEAALDKRPCGKCAACLAADQGKSSMDFIEIDGASHTGVDDVRSIIEGVNFRPAQSARTVYIIDEVHMLSNAAFNALLKTLEEPPQHALFLMATTEPEKIPSTVLSRVQRLSMRRLAENEILGMLEKICSLEKFKVSREVLERVSAAADGSLRDAETLLEQLLLLNDSTSVSLETVEGFLGTVGSKEEIELLSLVASRSVDALIKKIEAFHTQGKDLERLMERLLHWSRGLLLSKSASSPNLLGEQEFVPEHLQKLILAFEAWSVEDVDRLFEILWAGFDRIRKSDLTRVAMEVTLLRAARITLTEDLARVLKIIENSPTAPVLSLPPQAQIPHQPSAPVFTPRGRTEAPAPSPDRKSSSSSASSAPAAPLKVAENEADVFDEIKRMRPSLSPLVQCGKPTWKKDLFELRFPKGHFAFRQLSEKILHNELLELLGRASGGSIRKLELIEDKAIEVSTPSDKPHFMKEAKDALMSDPDVLKAAEFLGGHIESVTISGVRSKNERSPSKS